MCLCLMCIFLYKHDESYLCFFSLIQMEFFSSENTYALDNPFHEIDFIKYWPGSFATINNTNSNISVSFLTDANICLQNSYISIDF